MKYLKNLIWTSYTTSTNEQIKNYPDGTCLIACEQSSGRGRRGHTWFSPPGGLYFSFKESFKEIAEKKLLPFLVAIACHKSLGESYFLKWPNDLLNEKREKVGGILIESISESFIVGIGINLQNHFYTGLNGSQNALWLATKIINNIQVGSKLSKNEILDYWQKYCWIRLGNVLQAKTPAGKVIRGNFCGLGDYGELKIKTEDEIELLLHSGEIFEIRNLVK